MADGNGGSPLSDFAGFLIGKYGSGRPAGLTGAKTDAPVSEGLGQTPAKNHQLCPECGGKMTESERVCENGTTFVWFVCGDKNCYGQWLQKMPAEIFYLFLGSFSLWFLKEGTTKSGV
jgi:hypothetical protein